MLKNPSWTVAFDTDPALAADTRKKILNELVENRTRVFAYHLPFPGIGHIAKERETDFSGSLKHGSKPKLG